MTKDDVLKKAVDNITEEGVTEAKQLSSERTKYQLSQVLPYIGIPVLGIVLLLMQAARLDGFILLQFELVLTFGYIASVFDIKSKHIPNGLVLIMLAAWVLTMTPKLFLDTDTAILLLKDSAFGFLIGGGLFVLVYIVSKKGMGGGDVKFMAATGLYVGFAGIISTMLYGSVLAALTGLVLLLLKKVGRKDTMPLVPFLYIGILITIFYR